MNFIDTHIHLQDFKKICTKDILASALEAGVDKFVCVSSKEQDWGDVLDLACKYKKSVVPALGLHPWYVGQASEKWKSILEKLVLLNRKAMIGETGLDGNKDCEGQEEAFEYQLMLAKKYGRPVSIHALKSQNWFENNWHKMPEKFVFHSYNLKKEFLKEIISHGGYVSFSFSILSNKNKDELINLVPIDKILIETDGPYQSIEKNQENEPQLLPKLALNIAGIMGMESDVFARIVYNNSLEFIKVG